MSRWPPERCAQYVHRDYARWPLGQEDGGHISPLRANDEHTDCFLITDANLNEAPSVWVGSDDLTSATRTSHTVENRGYLLVSE